ncbi:hypothetical protein AVEN_218432-1, partial [Araneus ventricosus]
PVRPRMSLRKSLSSSVEWIAGTIRGLVDQGIDFTVDFNNTICEGL